MIRITAIPTSAVIAKPHTPGVTESSGTVEAGGVGTGVAVTSNQSTGRPLRG